MPRGAERSPITTQLFIMFHETGTVRFPFTICLVCFKAIKKPFKLFSNWFQTSLGFWLFDFLLSLQQISEIIFLAQTSFPTTKALHTRLHRFNLTNQTICTHVSLLFSPFGAPIGCWRLHTQSAALVPGKELKILDSRHGCRGCCSMGDFPLERLVSSRIRQDGCELERMCGICEHSARLSRCL